MAKLISKNPRSGETLGELELTPIESLPVVFRNAKSAQIRWAALSPRARSRQLLNVREVLVRRADEIIELISNENGKPKFEALSSEVIPCADTITFFAKKSPKLLRNRSIPLHLAPHRKSYLNYWPLGVVAVISPWNYPLLLPFAEIVMALAAGNAVVFKPSEVTPLVGMKIQELCEEAGLPIGLVQTLIGDGSLGAAIIAQKPAKIFFTGSVGTGKKIMAAAAEHLIPVNLELGGKDAMIVLPDANLDYATSAALWGGFTNSGQVCASTERLLLHESIHDPFLDLLAKKTSRLKPGTDLGAITFDQQKAVYENHLSQARAQGAKVIAGGEFSSDRSSFAPTIVAGEGIEAMDVYREETFGPVLAVTKFKNPTEAIQKANDSRYGLLASVITRNHSLGEQIARELEVGTAIVNEVTYTAGLGETPWGGLKDSGFGRTHSAMGLYEFVNVRHIHKPRARFLVFKSLWWFPYTPFQYQSFRMLLELYRRSWTDKLRAIPLLLWNFVKFLKEERRL